MAKDVAELLADNLTSCYASTKGCKRFPVRMVYEMGKDGIVECVMLCPDHAATYQPEGEVLSDTMLAEGQNLELLKEARW